MLFQCENSFHFFSSEYSRTFNVNVQIVFSYFYKEAVNCLKCSEVWFAVFLTEL